MSSDQNVEIAVPPVLASLLEQVVIEYAVTHGERPDECRRAVELAVLQRGLRSIQEEIGR